MSALLPWLRLLRVGTLFSPAADVLAGMCLSGATLGSDHLRLATASVCLYAAGMVLNDHADRQLDASQRPERPLPRGQIQAGSALLFGLILLAVCISISPFRLYHGAMALLVVGYDYGIKKSAPAGTFVMGTLRGMNLLAGALPAWLAVGGWPADQIWIPAASYGLYILGVTFLGILEDERSPSTRAVRGLVVIGPCVAFVTLLVTRQPWPAAAIGAVLLLAHLARHRHQQWDQAKIRGAMTWLLLGTMVYTGLLCLGSGRPWVALAVLAMILCARWISRRIALT